MTTDSAAREVKYTSEFATAPNARPQDAATYFSPGGGRAISGEAMRPAISKQWHTERPKPTTKASISAVPGLRRHTTNTSLLNEAIWKRLEDDGDGDSSTGSSSDNEDDIQTQRQGRGRVRGRHSKGSRGSYSRFNVGNDDFKTKGRVSRQDGRLNISVNETNNRGYLAKALGATFLKHLGPSEEMQGISPVTSREGKGKDSRASSEATLTSELPRPTLNIVVMVIGSRGDIQPFLKLGKNLKEYGHRVRIATHPAFKDFVQKDSGLEFFSVGGDPAELMAFMVKNPGMIPTMETLKKGEVGRRRDQMAEMFEGFWRACINATDDENDDGSKNSFCIPLHLMFTFPYTPTQAFPHPLANIKKSNVDPGYANFMSYPLVEMMTWQGLGDLVNNFRVKTLGLEMSTLWQLYRLKVPYTYLWSPGLVPKPKDWGPEIDVAGFVFLDLASSFNPPQGLSKFLDAGEPPVYIGFGSIVVDDPDKFTKMIFEAVKKAGVRALVSKGWGGLGDDNTPENVYMLENTPHDWLFPKVSAVVHHGGAGTTAIGLKCGKPTMIVPFFGDQQFWGSMIGEAGAGAKPVPYKSLTADKLAEGIKHCLTDEACRAAEKIAEDIEAEGDGAKNAVTSFHRSLVLRGQHSMRCSILEERVAVWSLKNTNLRWSALAAELLVERKRITWKQLRLIRHNEWNDFEGPGEPLTGGAIAVMGTVTGIATGIGSVPFRIAKTSKRRSMHEEKKRRRSEQHRRSESRDQDAANSRTSDGKPVNGSQANGHPNGSAIKNENEKPKETTAEDSSGDISEPKAPGTGLEKATCGADMGKHTASGEPLSQKQDAENEAQHEDDESELSDDPENYAVEEMAQHVGAGVGKTAEVIARAPMDLSLAIARGFHNAPRLYGDSTVRRPTRITGIKSGLKAAGEEFVLGIYDGVTGLVVQPYTGARDGGATGFVKGVGMGLTGFVLKDLAAIIGPFGYNFKGVHKELLKGRQPTKFIRKARILEGQRDLHALDDQETKKVTEAVTYGWSVVQQVWAIMDEKRSEGLRGRIHVMRERKKWRAGGAFENVEMAEKALEARRKGESLDGVFAEQREELQLTRKPRKNVVQDMEEGHDGQDDDRQVVQLNGHAGTNVKEKPEISA